MRLAILAAFAATLSVSPGLAQEVPLEYVATDQTSAEAGSLWVDFAGGFSGRSLDGSGAKVMIATVDATGDRWTATFLDDVAYCSSNSCSARVFRNDDLMFSGEICTNLATHFLRPDALQLRACDQTYDLSVQDQR